MMRSLTWKLALGFVLVAITTAGLGFFLVRLSTTDQLTQLLIEQGRSSMAQSLADTYSQNGSWEGIASKWAQIQGQTLSPDRHEGGLDLGGEDGPGEDRGDRSLFGLADLDGTVLVPVDPKFPAGSVLPENLISGGIPILVGDQPVGVMLVASQLTSFNPEEARFLERTDKALIVAMLGALVAALILGLVLSRSLTRPLQELTRAAQDITRGQLEQQVKVSSRDEIGQLALAFNGMSQEVARVNHLRRQMTADIAHDLRTPLTVIGGYIESMRDGVLQPTQQRLAVIYTEIERLQNLVNDLRVLTQADAGELPLNFQAISPRNLLERAAGLFQHHAAQRGVNLRVSLDGETPFIRIDEARMLQVLDNLIGNALRFTPSGGEIVLSARMSGGAGGPGVELLVSDTGSGISPEELPLIFDRFYRVDPSRHSEGGESGLGLAIVKAFVEAQQGRVWAESSPGQGATIHILFPA